MAARELLACISAVSLVKERPGFGRTVHPAPGSVLASPCPADWNPDPDYFFHWFRDAALAIDALRLWGTSGARGDDAVIRVAEYLGFESACAQLDGRVVDLAARRAATAPDHRKFLRRDADIRAVHGFAARAESRVEANGGLDLQQWGRPQHDGPALRVLALLRWNKAARPRLGEEAAMDLDSLVAGDLAFLLAVRDAPCFDLWEERMGRHYYTRRVIAAALAAGAEWRRARGEEAAAARCAEAAASGLAELDAYWSPEDGFLRSRDAAATGPADPDMAVVLAALHAGNAGEQHGFADPRIAATLACLQQGFARALGINHGRAGAPALGRWVGDVYFGGGAWFVCTFAAAEFHYRSGCACGDPAGGRARGDAFLEAARAFAPADGSLPEQIDRDSGAPLSAKRLAWSYAALLSCAAARSSCLAEAGSLAGG